MANNGGLRIAEDGLESSSTCLDDPQQSTGLLLSGTGAAPGCEFAKIQPVILVAMPVASGLAQEDGGGFAIGSIAAVQTSMFTVASIDNRWNHALESSPHGATATSDLYAMPAQNMLSPFSYTAHYQHSLSSTPVAASIQSLDKVAFAAASALADATASATSAGVAAYSNLAPEKWPNSTATPLDNIGTYLSIGMGPFQSLVSQPQQQTHQTRDQQRQPSKHQQSQQPQHQQAFDAYYRQQQQQQQQRPLLQHRASHPHIEQAGYASENKSPMSQVQHLLFDMHSFNSTPPDTTSINHPTASMQLGNIGTPASVGNYPLSLDTASMRSSATFPGAASNMYNDGTGNNSGNVIDSSAATSSHHLAASSSLPPTSLPLTAQPSQVASNGHNFMGSPLSTSFSGLSAMGAGQALSQHGHSNVGTPLAPHMRSYNMMFGIPGLTEPRMLYDDRMSLPPLPHNGGNWLRIRQPIDYVAPLKKPMNSFLLYSAERRVQLRQTHPDLNTTQQSTILAREWASLAEEEKEKYRAEAKQLRDDYNARRAELSLKLQQQLNQQHINMSLGQPPPPPLPHLHGHNMSHQPLLDTLDPNVVSGDQHAHVHQASSFGLQQQFSGPGIHVAHTQFSPTNSGGPNLHTPIATFVQTPQEDVLAQAHAATASHIAEAFHFEHALSTIDPSAMTGGGGHFHGLTLGRSTPQALDVPARSSGYVGDLDKQGPADSKWREFDLTASDNLHNCTAAARSYGIPRSSSSVSQCIGSSDFGQQRLSQQQQHYGYNDAENLRSNILSSTTTGLFGSTFDGAIQTGDFGSSVAGISSAGSKTLNHAASYASFDDVSGMSRIESSMFDYEKERTNEFRDDANRNISEHAAGHGTASQDPSHSMALFSAGDSSSGGLGTNTATTIPSKARARLSSPPKRTRKKTKKDPDAPKHPMSAFLYYLTSERPRLAEHLSDMSIGQQTKIIAKQWKTLDETDRAPWERLAQNDKDRYARERREYHGENRHTETAIAPN
ncbi:High mobility group [Coemansia sp. BCRC 34301]|nr:High mobility group [Coemansia sp. BCRC 34301]